MWSAGRWQHDPGYRGAGGQGGYRASVCRGTASSGNDRISVLCALQSGRLERSSKPGRSAHRNCAWDSVQRRRDASVGCARGLPVSSDLQHCRRQQGRYPDDSASWKRACCSIQSGRGTGRNRAPHLAVYHGVHGFRVGQTARPIRFACWARPGRCFQP
ncbi:hypothetical protein D9M68_768300 [compost metagenome]